MQKTINKYLWVTLLTAASAALTAGAHASLIGFNNPVSSGPVAFGSTIVPGWTALQNGDTHRGAAVYWYGPKPGGFNSQYQPNIQGPGGIPGYTGGAVWLDGTATSDLPPGTPVTGPGVAIKTTVNTTPGNLYTLSFFTSTEVSPFLIPPTNLKGNPADGLLTIDGNAPITFLTSGPFPTTQANRTWTQETFSFTATGSQTTIEIADDLANSDNNADDSSNLVVADVTLVPETDALVMTGLSMLGFFGFRFFRRKQAV